MDTASNQHDFALYTFVILYFDLHENHQGSAQVYLLDLGESVRVLDMTRTMIQLSGLTLRDSEHPQGDIAVQVTGLRPEKNCTRSCSSIAVLALPDILESGWLTKVALTAKKLLPYCFN